MDFIELVKTRYSVRKFEPKKVEKEKLDLILEAGRLAPTAVNYQPQRILVIESEEGLNKIKTCTKYHFHAPLTLLVCYDTSASWKRPSDGLDMGLVDASIVTTQMMLQITALGLGTTWVGSFDDKMAREAFDLPSYLEPVAFLPIGYPREDASPSPMHEKRLALKETVFFESFDGIQESETGKKTHS